MRPPILTMRREKDGSETIAIGLVIMGHMIPVDGGPRVQIVLPGRGVAVNGRIYANAAIGRNVVRETFNDWFELQRIFEPGDEIELQVEPCVA